MKITAISVHFAREQARNWTFVKVETDEGYYGWGEATLEFHEKIVETAVNELSQRVLGMNPTHIEAIWQRLYRHGFWRGGPVLNSAISGIEQACWDITGKVYGQPVYKLLGGPTRDRIRMYTHGGGGTPEQAAQSALEIKNQGFTAMKMGMRSERMPNADLKALDDLVANIESIRAAVGTDLDLMLDDHGKHRPIGAAEIVKALAPYHFLFLEELVPPDNADALKKAALAAQVHGVKLATGERLFTKWEFRDIIEQQLVDVLQPDICHCGGILEARKIAAMAETYYIQVAPHNPNGPISTAAALHLSAAIPNFLILEYARSSAFTAVQKPEATLAPKDGWMELPDRPGLGVDLNEDYLSQHPYDPMRQWSHLYHTDGAVADI